MAISLSTGPKLRSSEPKQTHSDGPEMSVSHADQKKSRPGRKARTMETIWAVTELLRVSPVGLAFFYSLETYFGPHDRHFLSE